MPWIGEDYTGKRYGKWTAISRDMTQKRPTKYLCRCDCGTEKIQIINNLKKGRSTQCTICQDKSRSSRHIGTKHYHLTVIDNIKVNGKVKFLVKCDCGNDHIIPRLTIGYKTCGKCSILSKMSPTKGKKIGLLTVLQRNDNSTYDCKCDCGNVINVKYPKFRCSVPSCGCYRTNSHIEKAKKLEGVTYYYLKVLKFLGMGEDKRATYSVKCKCGNNFTKSISHLFQSKSCGCLQKDKSPKGSSNYNSKTTESEVKSIRELFSTGYYTRKELSKMFDLSYEHVCQIIIRQSWKHI